MVLVKMLMEIDPLPLRGSMVMTMVMISPSQREVSLAEQLHLSPRLVPPRFLLVAAEFRPVSLLMIFPRTKDFIQQKMGTGGLLGGPRGRGRSQGVGRAPTLVDGGWPPSGTSFAQYFLYILKIIPVEFQDFGDVRNRSLIFAPFPAQNSSCRHSPSSCKPCKIRENRHKYCDIMCNNSP